MGVVYKAFHPGLKRTVALALQHAHEHGILHRDVKPASILPAQPDSPDGAARQTDRPDRRAGARGTGRGAHAGDLGHGEAGARQREDDRIRGRGEASSVPVRSGERARPAPDRIEAHFNRGKLLYGGEALRSAAARADPCPLLRDAAEACGEATPEEEAALARAREKAGKREGGREPK